MFNKISTKNLKIAKFNKIINITDDEYIFSDNIRYTLVRQETEYPYRILDAFTKSEYRKLDFHAHPGDEVITSIDNILTTKKRITIDEATRLLRTLNPTYLPGKEKVLKKSK